MFFFLFYAECQQDVCCWKSSTDHGGPKETFGLEKPEDGAKAQQSTCCLTTERERARKMRKRWHVTAAETQREVFLNKMLIRFHNTPHRSQKNPEVKLSYIMNMKNYFILNCSDSTVKSLITWRTWILGLLIIIHLEYFKTFIYNLISPVFSSERCFYF